MEAVLLLRDLAGGRLPGLLLVHGPEPFLVDELVGRVEHAVLGTGEGARWNREVIYADAVSPEELVGAGLALALFGERRLLLVRGLAGVTARGAERLRDAIASARGGPGGWPTAGTTALLVAAGTDARSHLPGIVPPESRVEVRPVTGRAVPGWLRERARALDVDLDADATQLLLSLVGEELGRLAGELDKAALFADGGRVTEEVVRALAGESRVRQYWELTDALEGGQPAQALQVLEQLLANREEPLALLAQIVGHLRDVWRLRALPATGTPREAAALLPRRRPDWAVERLQRRAAAWSASGLAVTLEHGFAAERGLKSGAGSARALLTALVAEVATPARS